MTELTPDMLADAARRLKGDPYGPPPPVACYYCGAANDAGGSPRDPGAHAQNCYYRSIADALKGAQRPLERR